MFNVTLASSREKELRTLAERPDHLMIRMLELVLKERP
jgi:hypothetical protein